MFAVSSIFNAVGHVYDRYTVFALHVVIIALYAKQLFGKEAKAKYLKAIELVESNKNLDNYDEYHEVRDNLVEHSTPSIANVNPNTRSINRSPYNSYIKNLTIIHERSNFALPLAKARV